jgi:threonine dehydrogenase-like Zn-dependent dehydrogenase
MRAVVLKEGRLEVRETADPVPGPGHLLLRVVSTAVCASDVHFMDHHDAIPAATSIGMVYDANHDMVLGQEFAGEVIGHGPDCGDQFPVGTRVTSMPILLADGGIRVIGQNPAAQGSFGERLVVSEAMARAVPDGVSPDAAALVDAFAPSLHAASSPSSCPTTRPSVVSWLPGSGRASWSTGRALSVRGLA